MQLIKLLDLNVDRRTKQHIEILRCLGLVESVVIPESGDKPVPLAPTVASRLEPASSSALHVLALCTQNMSSCWLLGSDFYTLNLQSRTYREAQSTKSLGFSSINAKRRRLFFSFFTVGPSHDPSAVIDPLPHAFRSCWRHDRNVFQLDMIGMCSNGMSSVQTTACTLTYLHLL